MGGLLIKNHTADDVCVTILVKVDGISDSDG